MGRAKGGFLRFAEFTDFQDLGRFEHSLEICFPTGCNTLFLDLIFMSAARVLLEIKSSSMFIKAEKRIFILKKIQLPVQILANKTGAEH